MDFTEHRGSLCGSRNCTRCFCKSTKRSQKWYQTRHIPLDLVICILSLKKMSLDGFQGYWKIRRKYIGIVLLGYILYLTHGFLCQIGI